MAQAIDSSTVTVTVSAHAAYCETKGIKPIAFYADATLEKLTKEAAAKVGKKHTVWLRDVLANAVRAEGFTYEPESKETLKEQIARLTAEMESLKAANAALTVPPTPPTVQANPETGKVEVKA